MVSLTGLAIVLAFAFIFHLDAGTASGLAAGSLTQSSMIGTSSGALAQLGLTDDVLRQQQANIAAGETVIADRGLWGRAYNERMRCNETELLTPARERTATNRARERALASTRLVIESVFSNLKEQMRLARHLAKTPRGLAQRIAQRLLALTLGILLNTISGRPARALAAYDGR